MGNPIEDDQNDEPDDSNSVVDDVNKIFAEIKSRTERNKQELGEPIGSRLKALGYNSYRLVQNLESNLDFTNREQRKIKGFVAILCQHYPPPKNRLEAAELLAADFAVFSSSTFIGSDEFELEPGQFNNEIAITNPSTGSTFAYVNYEEKTITLMIMDEESAVTAELTPDDVRAELKRYCEERLSDGLESQEE